VPDSVAVNNANEIKIEVDRFKREEIQQHFRTAAESARPLKQWAHEFRQECEPLLKSARDLNAMAERIRPTVLVVDDDELQRKIIAKLLKDENCHLVFAAGGVEVLSVLRKIRPDLILMDVMMPDMDGLEVVRLMKTVPRLADIPVIMITGKSGKNIVMESLKAGAIDFVVKPFDRDTLLGKVAQVLH
jgi:CheY-like chemotaxis protein